LFYYHKTSQSFIGRMVVIAWIWRFDANDGCSYHPNGSTTLARQLYIWRWQFLIIKAPQVGI
jgi:hypothetical protein